jgi:DNA-binding LacI/PurR family transcriptional regulator
MTTEIKTPNWKIEPTTLAKISSPFNRKPKDVKQDYRIKNYEEQTLRLSDGTKIKVLVSSRFSTNPYIKIYNDKTYYFDQHGYRIIPFNVDITNSEISDWLTKLIENNLDELYILQPTKPEIEHSPIKSYKVISIGKKDMRNQPSIIYINTEGCASKNRYTVEQDEKEQGQLCKPVMGGKKTQKRRLRKIKKSNTKTKSNSKNRKSRKYFRKK